MLAHHVRKEEFTKKKKKKKKKKIKNIYILILYIDLCLYLKIDIFFII